MQQTIWRIKSTFITANGNGEHGRSVHRTNAVFWDVAPHRSCTNRRFGGTYHLHLQSIKIRKRGKWRRYVPPKRRITQDLHGATSQKTKFFVGTSAKTSNLTLPQNDCVLLWQHAQWRKEGAHICVMRLFLAHSQWNVTNILSAMSICPHETSIHSLNGFLWSLILGKSKGKIVPALNSFSIWPWRRMGEWMFRSTFSWRRH
jgi:hypothetical protein